MMKLRCITAAVLVSLASQQGLAQVNLLNNSGFETQGSDSERAYYWEWGNPNQNGSYWGSAIRINWRSMSGSWIGAICGTWLERGTEGGWWQQVPATPGQRYRFNAWVYADGVTSEYGQWTADIQVIKIEFFSAADAKLAEHEHRFTDVGPNWVRKSIEAVAPANSAWVRVVMAAWGAGGNGALQFDDLELLAVDEPSDAIYPGPSSRRTGIVISEIMYHPADREDGKDLEYVELYNTTPFTNSLAGYRLSGSVSYDFAESDVLPPFSFLVVAKEPASVQSVYGVAGVKGPFEGNLPNSSGRVRLRKANPANSQDDAILLEVNYSDQPPWPLAADGAGHSLVLSHPSYGEGDPRAWSASIEMGGTPGMPEVPAASLYTNVLINELLAHTDEPLWDYIELFNTHTQAINIGGCTLSDSVRTNKFTVPAGTVIPAKGFLVYFSVTNPPSSSPTNLTFNLSSKGEDIVFRAPDGTVVDAVRFAAQENGVAMGRFPDGAADFHELASRTPAAANAALRIRDIVINEIMYNPISGDDNDQYVELHNKSAGAVSLDNWRFVEGIDFTFPAGTTLPAGGYLVVARNALHLMSNYPGVLNSGNTIGNFDGNLAKSGERIVLSKPDDPNLPNQDFVIVDEVTYHDGGRWGEWSDGGGSSLELIDPRSDNRQASNWTDSDESAKSAWTLIQYTNVLDNGMLPGGASIDEMELILLRRGQMLVDNVEVRRFSSGSEQANRISNSTFESGLSGWTIQGNVVQSGWASEGYDSSRSLHIRATGGGDNGANRIKTGLTSSFSEGHTAVLRARARWICGAPYLLMRLRGNYLEAEGVLPVPKNLGTPGQANSRKATNAGPAIWDVTHHPLLPATNQPVTVTARVHDPDGLDYVQLRYRLDPSTTTNTIAMTHMGGGVYSATIPGQALGQLVAFHIRARDAHASPVASRFPAEVPAGSLPGPGRECLVRFGETETFSELAAYRFWMTAANMNEWVNRERQSDEYLDVTFVAGRERAVYNAGIRFRGSLWVRPHLGDPGHYEYRTAYRLKIPADELFLGMDELNLDSLEQARDDTLQRERMCFRMAEELGLPISYQRYVFIFINGVQYPYAHADVHHVERDYFRTWFPGEDDGELLKVDDWIELNSLGLIWSGWDWSMDGVAIGADLGLFTTTGGEKKKARYRWNWEKAANAGYDNDYTGLYRLVDAANLSGNQYAPTLEALVDVQQWMKMIAFRHVIADWDGLGYHRGKNAFIYRPSNGRWNLIPWDMDFGLGISGHDWSHDLFDVDNMPVIEAMTEHPLFRRYYWQALRAAATGPMLSTKVNPVMDEVYAALRAQGVAAAHPWHPKDWIANRRGYILSQLTAVTNFSLTAASVSTNGNVVTLSGRAPIHVYTLTFNGVPYNVTWTTVTNWTMTMAIPSGPSTIIVAGFDDNGNQVGSSVSLNVNYSGSDVDPQDNVIINEIMYNPADELAEFLELHNRSSSYAFDLTGYRMAGLDFTFQQGAVIPPGGYLLLVENVPGFAAVHTNLTAVAGEYAGKLDNIGERLQLMRPVGEEEEVVDTVVYDRLPPWPAAADGQGPSLQLIDGQRDRNRVSNWGVDPVNLYTPGASNSIARSLPEFPRVWINELQSTNVTGVMDNNGEREPWLELYNEEASVRMLTNFFLSDDFDNLKKWQFPAGAFAPAEWFRLVWMDGQTGQTAGTNYHASFRLSSATSGVVALVYSNAGEVVIVDYLNYPAIPAGKSYGSYPDGDTFYRMLLKVPTPGGTNHPLTDAAMVELLIPRFMQGDQAGGENLNRLPYAFRVQINNLRPSSEYRASNRVVIPEDPFDQDGAGNAVYVKTDGSDFIRTTDSPRFREGDVDRRHVRFVTDASGSFTGWFVTEPSGNARFTPGNTVYLRMLLNDGMNGTNIEHYLTTTSAVSVIALGTASTNATGLVGYSHAGPKQFVALYDNAVGEGRPVSATYVEATGAAVDDKYATFYVSDVSGQANLWGTLIPNNFPSGVRCVESRSLLDGTIVHVTEIEDGWIGTIDPSGGLTPIALNAPPLIDPIQNVEIGPGSLLVLQTSAFDPDAPPQILTFSLAAAPAGAGIGPQTGEFRWQPGFDRVNTTNYITVRVMDDGAPQSLSDTRTFAVLVGGEEDAFAADGEAVQLGQDFVITWPSEIGTTYRVQYLHSLTSFPWLVLGDDVVATEAVSSKTDSGAGTQTQRYYRVLRLLD